MLASQERAAIKEGLAEWQANPYYCAGRVTVPAIMDTFACQCFFNRSAFTASPRSVDAVSKYKHEREPGSSAVHISPEAVKPSACTVQAVTLSKLSRFMC